MQLTATEQLAIEALITQVQESKRIPRHKAAKQVSEMINNGQVSTNK